MSAYQTRRNAELRRLTKRFKAGKLTHGGKRVATWKAARKIIFRRSADYAKGSGVTAKKARRLGLSSPKTPRVRKAAKTLGRRGGVVSGSKRKAKRTTRRARGSGMTVGPIGSSGHRRSSKKKFWIVGGEKTRSRMTRHQAKQLAARKGVKARIAKSQKPVGSGQSPKKSNAGAVLGIIGAVAGLATGAAIIATK